MLAFSTLASAIAGGGFSRPESQEERQEKQAQQQQFEEQERLRTENNSNDAPSLSRGKQVKAADPTIISTETEVSRTSPHSLAPKEIFEQRKKMILDARKKYQNRKAFFYSERALQALEIAFEKFLTVPHDDADPEIISLLQQEVDIYNSIACDYMDAAQAEVSDFDKVPRPYLDAIFPQERMLDFLNELKNLHETGIANEEQRRRLQEQVELAHDISTRIRTRSGGYSELIPNYSGPRFFPEMPH